MPEVEVPTATVNGPPFSGRSKRLRLNFCRLFGTTVPFEIDTLSRLYPTHDFVFVKPLTRPSIRYRMPGSGLSLKQMRRKGRCRVGDRR